ncbi:hypothetical protein, partial [Cecembia rubra]
LFFTVNYCFGKDIIFLKDGTKIKGEVLSVDQTELTFQTNGRSDYLIYSSEDVDYVIVESHEKLLEISDSMYLKGIQDAKIHHKRFLGNFCAGFFGGAIGFIIVAVTDAKTPDPNIVGIENLNSRDYREGFNKKAKGKNLKAAGFGMASGIILFFMFLSGFSDV